MRFSLGEHHSDLGAAVLRAALPERQKNVAFSQINVKKSEHKESDHFDASRHFTLLHKK